LLAVATLVVTGHVAALVAASAALCCMPHETAAGESTACPWHRAADETCSMAQCPMHGESSGHSHDAAVHPTSSSSHQQHDSTPTPANECELTCGDENLSPAMVLGAPGFLPSRATLHQPDLVTVRVTSRFLRPPDRTAPVRVPPPRG